MNSQISVTDSREECSEVPYLFTEEEKKDNEVFLNWYPIDCPEDSTETSQSVNKEFENLEIDFKDCSVEKLDSLPRTVSNSSIDQGRVLLENERKYPHSPLKHSETTCQIASDHTQATEIIELANDSKLGFKDAVTKDDCIRTDKLYLTNDDKQISVKNDGLSCFTTTPKNIFKKRSIISKLSRVETNKNMIKISNPDVEVIKEPSDLTKRISVSNPIFEEQNHGSNYYGGPSSLDAKGESSNKLKGKGDPGVVKRKYLSVRPKLLDDNENEIDVSPEYSHPVTRKDLGYICLACGAISSKEETAELHKNAHFSKFKCRYCPQAFLTKHAADMHINLHKGGTLKHVNDSCQCKLCGGAFISLIYLEFHICECHGEYVLQNRKVFHISSTIYDDGLDFKHDETSSKKRFRCGICNTLFTHILNLECHMICHKSCVYSCGSCDCTFSVLDTLLQHVRVHDNKKSNLLFDQYVQSYCQSVGDISEMFEKRQFEQVLEIKDSSTSGIEILQSSAYQGVEFNNVKSSNDCLENACKVGSLNNPNLRVLQSATSFPGVKIHNGKFIKSRNSDPGNSSSQKRAKESIIKCPYVNPYMYHFLPNGKYAQFFYSIR